jgi:hypothetical protein
VPLLNFSCKREAILPPFFFILFRNPVVISLFIIFTLSPAVFSQSPVSGFNPAILTDSRDGMFIQETAFCGDNALPLQAIFYDKWDGPYHPTAQNMLDIYWKTEVGFTDHAWRLAAFNRGEATLKSSRDAVELLRLVNLEQVLPVGRVFNSDMEIKGFSASGVEISRGISLGGLAEGLSLGGTVRYLIGERLQEGAMKGHAEVTGPKSYDFDLALDYVYDQNLAYRRRDVYFGYGSGYSADVGLRYVVNKQFNVELLFRDLGGRIYWKNVPYTTADATSDTKSFDENGNQVYRPTIRGYEGYKDYVQTITIKTDVALSYTIGQFALKPTMNFIGGRPLYWIDLRYLLNGQTSLETGYNTNYNVIFIGIEYKLVMLNIYMSDPDLSRTNAAGLKFSVRF